MDCELLSLIMNALLKIHIRSTLYLTSNFIISLILKKQKSKQKSLEKIGINCALSNLVPKDWHLFGIKYCNCWTLVGRLNTKNVSGAHIFCSTYCAFIYTSRVSLFP
jgi:hypothetical protein